MKIGEEYKKGKTLKEILKSGIEKIPLVKILDKRGSGPRFVLDAMIIKGKKNSEQLFLIGILIQNLQEEDIEKRIKDGTFKPKKVKKLAFKERDILVIKTWDFSQTLLSQAKLGSFLFL